MVAVLKKIKKNDGKGQVIFAGLRRIIRDVWDDLLKMKQDAERATTTVKTNEVYDFKRAD